MDLAALRQAEEGTAATAKAGAAATAAATAEEAAGAASGIAGLEVIVVGMSLTEVYDLIGQPSATARYQTGKAWIPFNFAAKDVARTLLLYKGQGRVVCCHDGYSADSRVLEVIIDPSENGYP